MPALNLSLGLRVIRGSAHMLHALVFEPLGQVTRDLALPIVAQKPWPVCNGDVVKARGRKRLVEVAVTSEAHMVGQSFQATM